MDSIDVDLSRDITNNSQIEERARQIDLFVSPYLEKVAEISNRYLMRQLFCRLLLITEHSKKTVKTFATDRKVIRALIMFEYLWVKNVRIRLQSGWKKVS